MRHEKSLLICDSHSIIYDCFLEVARQPIKTNAFRYCVIPMTLNALLLLLRCKTHTMLDLQHNTNAPETETQPHHEEPSNDNMKMAGPTTHLVIKAGAWWVYKEHFYPSIPLLEVTRYPRYGPPCPCRHDKGIQMQTQPSNLPPYLWQRNTHAPSHK